MKFKFKIQQYQTDAVESTVDVFAGQPSKTNAQYRRDLGNQKGKQVVLDFSRETLDFGGDSNLLDSSYWTTYISNRWQATSLCRQH